MKIKINRMKKLLLCVLAIAFAISYGCNGNKRPPKPDPIDKETIDTTPRVRPNVNVYVENSGSMDGYVKGATEFENIIYSYLSDIKISGLADSLNLFYINMCFLFNMIYINMICIFF